MAEGDRVDDPRGDRRAGRRGGRQRRHRVRHRHDAATARSWSSTPRTGRAPSSWPRGVFVGRRPGPACRRGRSPGAEAISEDDDARRRTMIRLGSLAGYPFEGPRVLAGWTAPAGPAVYAIVVQAGAGDQARDVRGDLRRPLRRPVGRALPVQPPARAVLDPSGRRPLEGLHLHLRGARRAALAPRADRPASSAPSTTRAATSSSTTRRGRTSGSASTPRRPPARSPRTATRRAAPVRLGRDGRLGLDGGLAVV